MFSNLPKTDYDRKCEFLFNTYKVYASRYKFKHVLKLTQMRKRKLAFVMNYTLTDLKLFLSELKKAAPVLSNADWFDFDWLCSESNVIKVMEGKYSKVYKRVLSERVETELTYKSREF